MTRSRAQRLKAARHSLQLTTAEMAEALGLRGTQAKDDLRKMEEGARPVTGPVLVAAEALVCLLALLDSVPTQVLEDYAAEETKRAMAFFPGMAF